MHTHTQTHTDTHMHTRRHTDAIVYIHNVAELRKRTILAI